MPVIGVTGATGHLGRLVVEGLLKETRPAEIVAAVRNPAKAGDLAAKGVAVRAADYERPEALAGALAGVEKLLLISANEVGKRFTQHAAVIAAAKGAGVKLLVYTSLLHADRSPLMLAGEHRQTEDAIRAAGLPFVFLRNGWYTENYTASAPADLQRGVHLGCAGDGRISGAARADYAEAAVRVLVAGDDQAGRVYELAGDEAFTLTQFAAEIARQAGRPVVYRDMPEAEYRTALVQAGLPEPVAVMLADSDAGAAKGALFDDGRQLSTLIERPTTPLADSVAAALKQ